MTASQKPKTPSMTMMVQPNVSLSDVDAFCKRASRLVLSQIVDNVTVKERLTVNGDARRTEFFIDITFFPREEYEAEYDVEPTEILAVFATQFPLILKKEIQVDMKKLDLDLRNQITELGKAKTVKTRPGARVAEREEEEETGGDDKDDDDKSEAGDGDADDEKRSRQKKEQTSYESDEEDEGAEPFDDDAIEAEYAENEDEEGAESGEEKSQADDLADQTAAVADLFTGNFHHATSFEFRESGCSIHLQVLTSLGVIYLHSSEIFFSLDRIFQNCFLLALLNGLAARLLYERYLESQNVSVSKRTERMSLK